MGCARDPGALQSSALGQLLCEMLTGGLVQLRTESHSNQTAQFLPQHPSVHSGTREELSSSSIPLHTEMAVLSKEQFTPPNSPHPGLLHQCHRETDTRNRENWTWQELGRS